MARRIPVAMCVVATAAACFGMSLFAPSASAATIYTISSGAIPLSNLVGTGNSIQVGDKIFDNFTYGTTGTDMPTSSNVNITPEIMTVGSQTMWGIGISGALMDTGDPGSSIATLGYSVHVVDPSAFQITSAVLFGDPGVIGPGQVMVTESLTGPVGSPQLQIQDVEPGNNQVLFSSASFAPVSSITVSKQILASVPDGSSSWATVTSIDQLYGQTAIPEPASLGVLALGALGLIARRRR